jgi:hypothetical protein
MNAMHAADHYTLLHAGPELHVGLTGWHEGVPPERNPIYLRVNESLDFG